jgi:hypothetical protein
MEFKTGLYGILNNGTGTELGIGLNKQNRQTFKDNS